jgi:hypothetical protein
MMWYFLWQGIPIQTIYYPKTRGRDEAVGDDGNSQQSLAARDQESTALENDTGTKAANNESVSATPPNGDTSAASPKPPRPFSPPPAATLS